MTREHHHDCGVPCPALIYTPWCPCWCHEPTKEDSEMSTLLERMAAEPCESFTSGSCADDWSGRSPDAPYLAYQYCPPCRLRAALAEGGMTYVHVSSEDIRRTQELAWDEGHYSSTHENPYRKQG